MKRGVAMVACAAALMANVTGCASTVARRIRSDQERFDAFPPEVQEDIRAGVVELGYTPDMVHLAWGKPDRKYQTIMRDDETQTWIYFGYRTEFVDAPPRWVPDDRWVYDRRTGRYYRSSRPGYALHEPISYRVPYEQRSVLFRDDAVIAIEQAQ